MTIDTIKDVLGRIISINKNLTEESLKNLLVASGWDNNDIEEGLKVYRSYGAKVEVTNQNLNQIPNPVVATPVMNAEPIAEKKETIPAQVISIPTEPRFIPTPPPFYPPRQNETYIAPTPTPVQATVQTPSPAPVLTPVSVIVNPVPNTFTTETKTTLPIITTEEKTSTFSSVALWVDIFLFILTLMLLIYVVSQ